MREVADGVHQIALVPRDGINAYVVGEVLVDAGIKGSAKKILNAVEGRALRTLAFTHAHVDHVGGAQRVRDALSLEVLAGARDVEAVQSGTPVVADSALGGLLAKGGAFDGVAVDRALREGDEVAGFYVLDTPGHSPGHIAFWRESDRTLICGDVFFNMNVFTTVPGLRWPLGLPTVDPERNRASGAKLAALEPETVLFGHGPPLTGAAPKLRAFVERSWS